MNNTQRITFLYRDGDNYKFLLTRIVETDKPLSVGDEVEYEKLGFDQDSFHSDVVGYQYDDKSDHNILEVIEAEFSDEEPNCTITA